MAPLKKIDALKDLSSADQLIYGKIDVSGLLNLVRDHPLLYRVAHPDHKSNSRKDSAWAAIGEELAIDGIILIPSLPNIN